MDEEIKMSQEFVDVMFYIEACVKGEYENHSDKALAEGKILIERLINLCKKIGARNDRRENYKILINKINELKSDFEDKYVIDNLMEG